MESEQQWTTSTLFSPSKARVHQAQAKEWAVVDSWLAKKYGAKRIPVFEKNENTLEVLLALANLNDSADEQRIQLERVEKAALQSLSRRQPSLSQETLQLFLSQLNTGHDLGTLAELIIALNSATTQPMLIGQDIVQLTLANFDTKQLLAQTDTQLTAIRCEKGRVSQIMDSLHESHFRTPSDIGENTSEWIKSTKHLKVKIAEYDDRISTLKPDQALKAIEMLQRKTAKNAEQRADLSMLVTQLDAWQDLPSDAGSVHARVEIARARLEDLIAKRDRLFESLTESI